MKTVLIIADAESQLKSILAQKNILDSSDRLHLLTFDDSFSKATKNLEQMHSVSSVQDLTLRRFHEIVLKARLLATNWYKSLSNKWEYKGIDIDWILEDAFSQDLTEIMQRVEAMTLIIDREKINKIYVVDDNSAASDVAILIATQKKIPIIKVKTPVFHIFHIKKKVATHFRLVRKFLKQISYAIGREENKNQYKVNERNAMIVIFEPNQVKYLSPLIKEMDRMDLKPFVVCYNHGPIEKTLQNENIDYTLFWDLLDVRTIVKITQESSRLRKRWKVIRRERSFTDAFIINEINLWNLVEDLFFKKYLKTCEYTFEILEVMTSTFAEKSIDIIIMLRDIIWPERVIIGAADLNNIPSLIVQHGVMADTWAYVPLYGTKMAVFGEVSKEFMIQHETESNRLFVTGSIFYDQLLNRKDFRSKSDICKLLNLDNDKCIITLATQAVVELRLMPLKEWMAHISIITEALNRFSDVQLVIKLHPAEKEDKYKYMLSDMKIDVKIVKDTDFHSLLKASDTLLTESSTVGLDAMILGIPVITMNFTGRPDVIPYASSGAAIGVKNQKELTIAIKNALYDEDTRKSLEVKRDEFLEDYLYKLDGLSSERVVNLIIEMINENKNQD